MGQQKRSTVLGRRDEGRGEELREGENVNCL